MTIGAGVCIVRRRICCDNPVGAGASKGGAGGRNCRRGDFAGTAGGGEGRRCVSCADNVLVIGAPLGAGNRDDVGMGDLRALVRRGMEDDVGDDDINGLLGLSGERFAGEWLLCDRCKVGLLDGDRDDAGDVGGCSERRRFVRDEALAPS